MTGRIYDPRSDNTVTRHRHPTARVVAREIRNLYRQGLEARAISIHLRCDIGVIVDVLTWDDDHAAPPSLPERRVGLFERATRARRLHGCGWSPSAIAHELGLPLPDVIDAITHKPKGDQP